MASFYIVRRETRAGKERFHAKFEGPPVPRPGGVWRSQLHLGVFRTRREAEARLRWARVEWSEGRVPDPSRILAGPDRYGLTIRTAASAYLASRLDLADATRAGQASQMKRLVADLGSIRVDALTVRDVQEWIGGLAERYAPGTVSQWLTLLRLVLEHAGVAENVARDRRVRLPAGASRPVRIRLPTTTDVAVVRLNAGKLDERAPLLLDFLEDTGARIGEALRVSWEDVHADRVLVIGGKGRGGRSVPRWVDEQLHPVRLLREQRGEGRVWPGVTVRMVQHWIERATPGDRRFSPHDYRHLHISRLVHSGASPVLVAARVGHRDAEITLRVYSHIVPS